MRYSPLKTERRIRKTRGERIVPFRPSPSDIIYNKMTNDRRRNKSDFYFVVSKSPSSYNNNIHINMFDYTHLFASFLAFSVCLSPLVTVIHCRRRRRRPPMR